MVLLRVLLSTSYIIAMVKPPDMLERLATLSFPLMLQDVCCAY